MLPHNLLLNTDSYKASHFLQYPPNTDYVSSYIESRGGRFSHTLFFGLQMFLKAYLLTPITRANIEEAALVLAQHGLPFHRAGWEYILEHHQGKLPIIIEAAPEGALVPVQNILVQIVNTDPACYWLTGYLETALLRAVWYPTTVATHSWACKQIIRQYLDETADSLDSLPFKLHDFGARGASSFETAALGGAAHLVNFLGTDTISGILAARHYYHEEMAGFSIPAAEHATITSWGREQEGTAYANMIQQFSGEGKLFAVVSDSYDIWHAVDALWGGTLKEKVMQNGGTLVIRPDSGDPVEIVRMLILRLFTHFGYSTNSKGYKLLPPYLRVIQGGGVSLEMIQTILEDLKNQQISADNIAFGMGGELLQNLTRDTMQFAMKASAIYRNGQWMDVYKDPVTDSSKRSKKGRLALIYEHNSYSTIPLESLNGRQNHLVPVFRDGALCKEWTFQEIRLRALQNHYIP
jgi:nicotinamide phosphoribosyltransferase